PAGAPARCARGCAVGAAEGGGEAVTALTPAQRLALRAREIRARALEDPLRWIKWLPVQLRYLQERNRFRLFRAGNQSVGKTTAGLADMLMDAMGTHPYRASVRIP